MMENVLCLLEMFIYFLPYCIIFLAYLASLCVGQITPDSSKPVVPYIPPVFGNSVQFSEIGEYGSDMFFQPLLAL